MICEQQPHMEIDINATDYVPPTPVEDICSFLDLDPSERKPFYSLDEVLRLIAGATIAGEAQGRERGYVAGHSAGHVDGYDAGFEDGFDDAEATFNTESNA